MDAVAENRVLQVGKWRVEPTSNRISCIAETIRLESQNMKLLLCLATRPGEVISREEIEGTVWRGLAVTPNSVYQGVTQLRRALGDDKAHPIYIETVPRKGYRLVAPVSVESAEPPEPPPADVQAECAQAEHGSRRFVRGHAALIALGVILLGAAIHLHSDKESGATAISKESMSAGWAEKFAADLSAARNGAQGTRALLLTQLGHYALNFGHLEQARMCFEEALALESQVSGTADARIARILVRLANVDLWSSRYDAAEANARAALQIFEQAVPALHPDIVRAHDVMTNILLATGRNAEASIHAERALEVARLVYGEAHIRTIDAESSLATLRLAEGRLDEAEAWARRALEKYIATNGTEQVDGVFHRTNLALVLYKKGSHAEAAAETRKSLEILARIAPPNHLYVASAQHILGESLTKLGKFSEAERALVIELRILRDNKAERWRIARAMSSLGEVLLGQGRIRRAEDQLMFAAHELDGAKGWLETDARLATEQRIQRLRQVKVDRTLAVVQP